MNTITTPWLPWVLLLTGAVLMTGCVPSPADSDITSLPVGIKTMTGDAGVDGRQWLESFEQAQSIASETNRPVLVDFTGSDWCGWCIRLDEEVFEKPEFVTWAKENVVLLKLDYPQSVPQSVELAEQNQQLLQEYGVQGFPTILFLDPSGKPLGNSGYLEGGPANWIKDAEAKLNG